VLFNFGDAIYYSVNLSDIRCTYSSAIFEPRQTADTSSSHQLCLVSEVQARFFRFLLFVPAPAILQTQLKILASSGTWRRPRPREIQRDWPAAGTFKLYVYTTLCTSAGKDACSRATRAWRHRVRTRHAMATVKRCAARMPPVLHACTDSRRSRKICTLPRSSHLYTISLRCEARRTATVKAMST